MLVPLALLNLIHDKARTLAGLAGVSFATFLVFMQLGFYGSVEKTASIIYDELNFDILLCSREYVFFSKAGTFSQHRLRQVQSVPGVMNAVAFYTGFNLWRNPESRRRRGILVMAFDPKHSPFRLTELAHQALSLQKPDTVLIDRRTRREYGPQRAGTETELGSRTVEIVGHFTLGTGFGAEGAVVMSDQNFCRLFGGRSLGDVSLGLLTIEPGSDPNRIADELRRTLPQDVQVLTRGEVIRRERQHWVRNTSIGIIFGMGVLVAIIVGATIVYQVLASHILNHLAEYATLKAMGYNSRHLSLITLEQSLIVSMTSFVPAFLLSLAFYELTRQRANIPMEMPLSRVLLVYGFSTVMCSLAALLSLRKVRSADPADLF